MLSAKSVDEIGKISEPCVNHLHGFLGSQQKTKLILSDLDYFHVYLNQTKNTRIQTKLLRNHTCIFVGSSMSDVFQMSIIEKVKEAEDKNKQIGSVLP